MSKQVFISPIDESFLTERDTLGDLRWEGNRCYKYVKLHNSTGDTPSIVGDKAMYASDDGYSNNTVVMLPADSDTNSVGAGVISAPAAGKELTDYYMWIQIKGPVLLVYPVTDTTNSGDAFVSGSPGKKFTVAVDFVAPVCGILINSTDKLAYLDCPF